MGGGVGGDTHWGRGGLGTQSAGPYIYIYIYIYVSVYYSVNSLKEVI